MIRDHQIYKLNLIRRKINYLTDDYTARIAFAYIFNHQAALRRRLRSNFLVFDSSCHLPSYLPHMVEA